MRIYIYIMFVSSRISIDFACPTPAPRPVAPWFSTGQSAGGARRCQGGKTTYVYVCLYIKIIWIINDLK